MPCNTIASRREKAVNFQIRGFSYWITPHDVLRATMNIPPNPSGARNTHFVTLHGEDYPIKQVLRLVIGQPRTGFHTHDARRILSRLDFCVLVRQAR